MGFLRGVRDYLFRGGNIGHIARNLAYIYCRIEDKYGERFPTLYERLYVTAFIDLFKYFKEGKVSTADIVRAVDSVMEDSSLHGVVEVFAAFTIRIEYLIFSIHYPRLPLRHVVDAVDDKSGVAGVEMFSTIEKYESGARVPELDGLIDSVLAMWPAASLDE